MCLDKTIGYCGTQLCFDKDKIGIEGPGGLGYSGSELEGHIIKGNEFNYITTHAKAIMSANRYNIVSCSKHALGGNITNIDKYDCIDLILGLEKNDGYSLKTYKTFTPKLQDILAKYTNRGGNLLVSGAYVGSDMTDNDEREFLKDVLHIKYTDSESLAGNNTITGMGVSCQIFTLPNEFHYASTSVDIISPTGKAFSTMTDYQGRSVCVAYEGNDCRTFTMGFPFECITSYKKQSAIMRGVLNFLCK